MASKTKAAAEAAKESGSLRVVCSIPTIGPAIMTSEGPRSFASISIDGKSLLISERMTPEEVQRLETIDGYTRWDGDEAEHGRAIEDALVQSRREQGATSGGAGEAASYKQQLRDQQGVNRSLSSELSAARGQIEKLTAENAALRAAARPETLAETEELRRRVVALESENAALKAPPVAA